MTKNHQLTTVLFAIALAGLLLVSTSAVGNGHTGGWGSGSGSGSGSGTGSGTNSVSGSGSGSGSGSSGSSGSGTSSGRDPSNNLLVDGNNTGINIRTDTNQPQTCQTV